jgi:hypothetical protein
MRSIYRTAAEVDHIARTDFVTSASKGDLLLPDMILTSAAGNHLVLFNAKHTPGNSSPSFSSEQGILDLAAIANNKGVLTATNPQTPIFNSLEVLLPGIDDVPLLTLGAGIITLDGLGQTNPLFV